MGDSFFLVIPSQCEVANGLVSGFQTTYQGAVKAHHEFHTKETCHDSQASAYPLVPLISCNMQRQQRFGISKVYSDCVWDDRRLVLCVKWMSMLECSTDSSAMCRSFQQRQKRLNMWKLLPSAVWGKSFAFVNLPLQVLLAFNDDSNILKWIERPISSHVVLPTHV